MLSSVRKSFLGSDSSPIDVVGPSVQSASWASATPERV